MFSLQPLSNLETVEIVKIVKTSIEIQNILEIHFHIFHIVVLPSLVYTHIINQEYEDYLPNMNEYWTNLASKCFHNTVPSTVRKIISEKVLSAIL